MSDTFAWALPPTSGQVGGGETPQPQQPAASDADPAAPPYGFRRLGPIGDVPPFNRYIPTWQNPALRDRDHGDWGSDDWVLEGMNSYRGGVPEGMHVPTERDIPGIMNSVTRGLGQYAAPGVAMPMIQAGKNFNAANAAYMKGYTQQAQINRQQMLQGMELANYRLGNMLRQYGNAYAEYAPDKEGKGGEPEELANRLREIAIENNDTNMLHMLDRGDMAAVDKLLKHLDGQGQDLKKTKALLDIQLAQQKVDKGKAAIQTERDALEPYRLHNAPGAAAPSPTKPADLPPPPPETPGDPGLEWAPAGTPATADAGARSDAETPDTDASAAGDEPAAPDAQAQAAPAGQPRVMAQDDAGPPNQTQDTGKADRLPLGAPAQAAQAAAPSPSEPAPAAPTRQAQPAAAKPAQAPAWTPTPSRARQVAERAGFDPDIVNQLAMRMANGSIKIQDLSAIPKPIRALAEARRAEIENDMDSIQKSDLKRGDVYTALDKVNPEFSAVLKSYVQGDAPVPASAWRNPSYLNRTLGLGTKVDETFNSATFPVRAATKRSFAYGQDARNITSVATLDFHATRYLKNLDTLKRMDPSLLKMYFGTSRFTPQWLAHASPQERQLFGQLDEDAHTVANEYERAVTGGKPTVSGRNQQEATMNWRSTDVDAVMANVKEKQLLAHERMKRLYERYHAVVGRNVDSLSKLYEGYIRGDAEKNAPDELGDSSLPTRDSNSAAWRLIQGLKTPAPAAPAAPAGNGGWSIERMQ
jgi:hypothetical protein